MWQALESDFDFLDQRTTQQGGVRGTDGDVGFTNDEGDLEWGACITTCVMDAQQDRTVCFLR